MIRRRGSTLADVLVASGLFVLVLSFVVLSLRTGRAALAKTDVHSETFRTAATANDLIRADLQGARVEGVGDGTVLTYRHALRVGGVPQVQASGALSYASSTVTVACDAAGSLVRTEVATGKRRLLARLGSGGSARFELLDRNRLRVTVLAVVVSDTGTRLSSHEIQSETYLSNQP